MIDTYKAIRVAQGILLLAAGLTGLSWFEDARTQQTQQLGGETLTLDTRAPVENAQGPWTEDMVFTEAHAGIPLGVAPTLNATARYASDGLPASEHAWSGTLTYTATGDGGSTWWTRERPVALNTSGQQAWVQLDLPQVVGHARAMVDATDVPSRLSISLEIRHEARVVVDGDARETSHAASVELVPREGFVVPQTHDDSSTYAAPVDAATDWTPVALVGAVVLAEGGAVYLRRGREPWEGAWGVDAVVVEELDVPATAATTELEALLSTARNRTGSVYVDRSAGLVLAPGDPPLVAAIDGDEEALGPPRPTAAPIPGGSSGEGER